MNFYPVWKAKRKGFASLAEHDSVIIPSLHAAKTANPTQPGAWGWLSVRPQHCQHTISQATALSTISQATALSIISQATALSTHN